MVCEKREIYNENGKTTRYYTNSQGNEFDDENDCLNSEPNESDRERSDSNISRLTERSDDDYDYDYDDDDYDDDDDDDEKMFNTLKLFDKYLKIDFSNKNMKDNINNINNIRKMRVKEINLLESIRDDDYQHKFYIEKTIKTCFNIYKVFGLIDDIYNEKIEYKKNFNLFYTLYFEDFFNKYIANNKKQLNEILINQYYWYSGIHLLKEKLQNKKTVCYTQEAAKFRDEFNEKNPNMKNELENYLIEELRQLNEKRHHNKVPIFNAITDDLKREREQPPPPPPRKNRFSILNFLSKKNKGGKKRKSKKTAKKTIGGRRRKTRSKKSKSVKK